MACDGLFFKPFALLHSSTRVPVVCILGSRVLASVSLSLAPSTNSPIAFCLHLGSFMPWSRQVFCDAGTFSRYAASLSNLGLPSGSHTLHFGRAWLILNTLFSKPVESIAGLVMMSFGLPLYVYFKRSRLKETKSSNRRNKKPLTIETPAVH